MADGVRAEIEQINLEFEEAFSRGDFEGIAALYSEDAIFLPPGMPLAEGREAIRDRFAALAKSGVTRMKFETLKVEEHGHLALEMARSTTSFNNSDVLVQTSYTIVWKRHPDGALQLHWDVVSSSTT